MPRTMPGLTAEFASRVAEAVRLAEIGEIARAEAAPHSQTRQNLHYRRLELLYEMAFMRIFVGWEWFLEQAFLRYLCGYQSAHGMAVLKPGRSFSNNIATAETAMLGAQAYFLWHSTWRVTRKSDEFFTSSPVHAVVSSNAARLDDLANIRHRIAHSQTDARRKFDLATMAIAGKRYRGSVAGAFLRDVDTTGGQTTRWIVSLAAELQGLAGQIA